MIRRLRLMIGDCTFYCFTLFHNQLCLHPKPGQVFAKLWRRVAESRQGSNQTEPRQVQAKQVQTAAVFYHMTENYFVTMVYRGLHTL